MKPMYVVDHHGLHAYDSFSLTAALRFIAKMIHGERSGAMVSVTASQAVTCGYAIRQC